MPGGLFLEHWDRALTGLTDQCPAITQQATCDTISKLESDRALKVVTTALEPSASVKVQLGQPIDPA